ncbi:hypothetical protein LPW11_00530 [Geomonas sp. RF6]|uniref:hypothetical protein n=1 Tax=Geomonas sp. RF6 TaxID=2897342 RepID=UPI001E3982CE|nr:hypothetical protein [Geomonas sp. RF6]UFS70691.1 hypothetical protein LPW11_00530 [Geomonas sp. RF6]
MEKPEALNVYGDFFQHTTGSHGVEIAHQRFDSLDQEALAYALTIYDSDAAAVDIGGGFGIQGIRFALTGMDTTVIDLMDQSERMEQVKKLLGLQQLRFLCKDVRQLTAVDLPENLQLVYSQRFIHYLTFPEATTLISLISGRMKPGARLFLSGSGIDSELGTHYAGKGVPVESRFALLDAAIADKHGIHAPVCLYCEKDLQRLVEPHGFTVDHISKSAFGNIKAAFTKR